jgi:hypothetical protein
LLQNSITAHAAVLLLLLSSACADLNPSNTCAHKESYCDGNVAHDCAETGGGRSSVAHLEWAVTDCALSGQSCFLAGASDALGSYPMAICALRDERCSDHGDNQWCEGSRRIQCYNQTQLAESYPQVIEDCAATGKACAEEKQPTFTTTRCQ